MTSHRPVFISKRSLITGALFCRMWRTIIMSVINKTTLGLLTLFCSPSVLAQLPGIISQPLANGGQSWSLPVQTLVFITTLSFARGVTDDDQFYPHHYCARVTA